MKKTIYLSTPIYYANDNLHLGHAYSTLYADFLANFYRQQGHPVVFVTGADQHGQKIYQAAQAHHQPPTEFIQQQSQRFQKLWKYLGINYDHFVETHHPTHQTFVKQQFQHLLANQSLDLRKYRGWYCISCETFIKPTSEASIICPQCQSQLTATSELNYFFTVSAADQTWIKQQLQIWQLATPHSKYFASLKSLLELPNWDFSISRSNVKWGIVLQHGARSQTAYVWFDALFSYLSSLPLEQRQQIWQTANNSQIIQVLGKEISKFHLIYWPLLLRKTGFRCPDRFLIHGWLLNKAVKMSKSRKNALAITPFVERYGLSVFRLFMAALMFPNHDVELSLAKLDVFYQTQIVDNLSNYCHRVLKMIQQFNWTKPTNFVTHLQTTMQAFYQQFTQHLTNFAIGQAMQVLFRVLNYGNKYIEQQQPWLLVKTNPHQLQTVLTELLLIIRNLAVLLAPIAPLLAKQIGLWFNSNNKQFTWDLSALNDFHLPIIMPLFKK